MIQNPSSVRCHDKNNDTSGFCSDSTAELSPHESGGFETSSATRATTIILGHQNFHRPVHTARCSISSLLLLRRSDKRDETSSPCLSSLTADETPSLFLPSEEPTKSPPSKYFQLLKSTQKKSPELSDISELVRETSAGLYESTNATSLKIPNMSESLINTTLQELSDFAESINGPSPEHSEFRESINENSSNFSEYLESITEKPRELSELTESVRETSPKPSYLTESVNETSPEISVAMTESPNEVSPVYPPLQGSLLLQSEPKTLAPKHKRISKFFNRTKKVGKRIVSGVYSMQEEERQKSLASFEVKMEWLFERWEADMTRTIKASEKAEDILRRLLEILLRHRKHMDARREVLRELYVNFTEENTRLLCDEKETCERMVDNLRNEMTLLQKKALLEWG